MGGGAGSCGPEAGETETTSVPWTGGPLEYLQGAQEKHQPRGNRETREG